MFGLAGLETSGRSFTHFTSPFFSTISFYVKSLFCYFHKFLVVIAVVPGNTESSAAGWRLSSEVLRDSSVSAEQRGRETAA